MKTFWRQINFHTHNQVFLRVIPIVVVTVLAVGAFSWIVFATNLQEHAANHQGQEMTSFLGNLRHRASLEAITLEYWKEEGWDEASRMSRFDPGARRRAREAWIDRLVEFDLVDAVAMVRRGRATEASGAMSSFSDSLDNAVNRRILDGWMKDNALLLADELDLEGWIQQNCEDRPVLTEADDFHSIYLLPPLLLQVSQSDAAGYGRASRQAVLPILVRENQAPEGPSQPSIWSEESTHGVFFMNLAGLIAEVPIPDWWCLLDSDGVVLSSRSGLPFAGVHLHEQTELPDSGIFGAISGAELSRWMDESPAGMDHELAGWRDTPWLVTTSRAREMPMTVLIARPAGHLKTMTMRYAAAILAVALAALLGSFVGIAKVMAPVSRRLREVSGNMDALAGGDYAIRMSPGPDNEVERLVGYFNTMARSLDGANRQLAEKTRRLAGALENLTELDQAKDDFLVLISHEVRTPLTAIMGSLDYLKSAAARGDEAERAALEKMNVVELAEIMDHSAARLRDFMNDAVQMISIQNSSRELALQPVVAADFLETCLAGVREKAAECGLTVENRLPGGADWTLLCDAEVLRVALGRILDNAVVHNEPDGLIRISEAESVPGRGAAAELASEDGALRLLRHLPPEARTRRDVTWRLIEVHNSGEAIPEDRQEALFSKFQIVGDIQHHQKGSGLSLPIALAAVEHHGGGIYLHSEKWKGNSFYLLLPAIPAQSGHQQAQGFGGAAGYEEIGQPGNAAGLEIELDDAGAGRSGGADQSGGGIDGAGGAHDEEEVTVPGGAS